MAILLRKNGPLLFCVYLVIRLTQHMMAGIAKEMMEGMCQESELFFLGVDIEDAKNCDQLFR